MSPRVSLLRVIGIPTGGGAAAPVNTVPPAIPASAVIGTQLVTTPGTWTGATTLTYQWQRNTGSWVNISGATSANYTPVDADFGRALRVVETANGAVSANSNETGLTAEAPVQSLGSNLVVDGDMEAVGTGAYTAVNATLSKQTTTPYEGTRCLRVVRDGSAARADQTILTVGAIYQTDYASRGDGTNFLNVLVGGTDTVVSAAGGTLWVLRRGVFRATGTTIGLNTIGNIGNYAEGDAFAVNALTLNTQLAAPSANMRTDFFYTLPGSPVEGDQIWLMPRVSDFAAGNYWLAWLRWTGSQWDINLYSVATHTRTSRIAATNIGTTNGIRVNANGDSWSLFTTADGGSNWTQRGSTITNATYQTATGVNVLHTSSVTAGNLLYAPAT